ncbi:Glycosyltransferase involved in cell wall bisynthesis [Geodermatophilus siccatus]|uniref:Glycosyltransferase involved in cell wall bisynthesis n=1 Tax=Geodermatophilus siccatus TaxID=1137991 RepID=A0A1G9MMX2_9ACTN|nr:glycosyltransferase family 4 protein [Geodermatophilus siccatus]SDL75371.1 Glycosyltransferase involved in cell wall bisynthesis [Geodermatophilus siccatus]
MRILIWHGYLLEGSGSNVYTRELARAWSRMGHEVVVLCQEPHPERYDLGGAAVVRPGLPGPLPVFVMGPYEDVQPRLLTEMDRVDREGFVAANAAAVRAQGPADLLLVNHVLLGAPVGAASGLPYVVKAHGSELEFAMRGDAELCAWARETLSGAAVVLAGSRHVSGVLSELVGVDPERVAVVPPGVDVEALRPRERAAALTALVEESLRDPAHPAGGHDERLPDVGNAERLAAFLSGDRRTVLYVGSLSAEKGVSLLLEALHGLDARAVVVGFGPARAELAAAAGPDVLFTGPLQHRHLAHLWPLADVSVVPSVFPEAFGMVAAEAAACGSPPLVARHSGLAEIAAGLEEEYPPHLRHLASFTSGDVEDLRTRLGELLDLDAGSWRALSRGARRAAVRLWSWDHVAGRIRELAAVAGDDGPGTGR